MILNFADVKGSILDVKEDKRKECFNFGIDNAFPSLIETLINCSVTSKTCVDRVAKAIYGKGFAEFGKNKVNSAGQTLNEVLRISSREYSKHNNCYIHVSYNALLEIKAISVIHTKDVRIGKADDRGYSGKFIVYDNWDKSKASRIMQDNFKLYDKYNSSADVVEAQIRANAVKLKLDKSAPIEDLISQYNGQILHIKKDTSVQYSLPDLFPVMSESLLESKTQTFRLKGSDEGFLNTKVLTTQPFKGDDARKDFKKNIKALKGSDNAGKVIHIELSERSEDISKSIDIRDLTGSYNDKLFEYSDSQAEKNICKAFGVPLILVRPADGAMFSDSGVALKEAKKQLWESREEDRMQIVESFSDLLQNFSNITLSDSSLDVINPFEIKEVTNE